MEQRYTDARKMDTKNRTKTILWCVYLSGTLVDSYCAAYSLSCDRLQIDGNNFKWFDLLDL